MAKPHITVCVCTFKRPHLLTKLLQGVAAQRTDDAFTYSVVVADNDAERSAEPAVADFRQSSSFRIVYCDEPEPNIALARNKALEHAEGDYVAFIDDDEYPDPGWLLLLLKALQSHRVDAVLGPVVPDFEREPPVWIRKGKFFDRRRHATGQPIGWQEARSGNVLFPRAILRHVDPPFRPQFATAGEDVDFFRRLAQAGCSFAWCDEAVVSEVVPPFRCTRAYLLRRAALRGSNFPKHPTHRFRNAVKSVFALPVYVVALPVLALIGHHVFMTYLIKCLDHGARLLAFMHLPVVKERQT